MGRSSWDDDPKETDQQRRKVRGQERTQDRTFRPARKLDPQACPPGYDPEVWSLTLLFEQLSAAAGVITLRGPLLYSMLEQRTTELRTILADPKLRSRPWKYRDIPMPAGVWSVDGVTRVATWQELTEAAIRREFGEYVAGDDQASWFCGKVRFWEMITEVRKRGYHKHLTLTQPEPAEEVQVSGPKKPKKPLPAFVRGHAV
jgi:hypothetical protein